MYDNLLKNYCIINFCQRKYSNKKKKGINLDEEEGSRNVLSGMQRTARSFWYPMTRCELVINRVPHFEFVFLLEDRRAPSGGRV